MTDAAGDDPSSEKLKIGISACLLGQEVRFDGGHKLDRFLRDTLGSFVQFVPVCPELELGLGVPREAVRLVRPGPGAKQLRLVGSRSGADHTEEMLDYARRRCAELEGEALCGYVFKKDSPSCGMERVRTYRAGGGSSTRDGRGLFAQVLMEQAPLLPVEEEGRLNDPVLRDNFVVRVFAYRRLRRLFRPGWCIGDLVRFHSREKLLLLAHDRPGHDRLGRLVAHAKERPRDELERAYSEAFLTTLSRVATRPSNTNVLQHAAGHFKRRLDAEDRAELRELIEDYRRGQLPLIVPITLIRHHVRRNRLEYLAQQTYLSPHPRELMLRNHV